MVTKLNLFEFIKYSALDEIIYENHIDDNRVYAREEDYAAKQNLQPEDPQVESVEKALANFIVQQLPNIRLSANALSLNDLVIKNHKNFTDTISNDGVRPLFYMLCSNINSWLKSQPQMAVRKLLEPLDNKITQLVIMIAPLVSEKLKGV